MSSSTRRRYDPPDDLRESHWSTSTVSGIATTRISRRPMRSLRCCSPWKLTSGIPGGHRAGRIFATCRTLDKGFSLANASNVGPTRPEVFVPRRRPAARALLPGGIKAPPGSHGRPPDKPVYDSWRASWPTPASGTSTPNRRTSGTTGPLVELDRCSRTHAACVLSASVSGQRKLATGAQDGMKTDGPSCAYRLRRSGGHRPRAIGSSPSPTAAYGLGPAAESGGDVSLIAR